MCKPGSVGDLGGQPPRSTRPGFLIMDRHRISFHCPTTEASLGKHVGPSVGPTTARTERNNHVIGHEEIPVRKIKLSSFGLGIMRKRQIIFKLDCDDVVGNTDLEVYNLRIPQHSQFTL